MEAEATQVAPAPDLIGSTGLNPCPIPRMTTHAVSALIHRTLLRLFVNNRLLHSIWHCHQRPERSFRVKNRQFHICARCTGIFTGLLAAPVWVPLHPIAGPLLVVAVAANALDGGSQLVGWRESTNPLRFLLGALLAAAAVAYLTHLTLELFR